MIALIVLLINCLVGVLLLLCLTMMSSAHIMVMVVGGITFVGVLAFGVGFNIEAIKLTYEKEIRLLRNTTLAD